jgi:HAD superfamily phosphoserine phosphatase-like hydrolase
VDKPLALFDMDKTMFNGLSFFPLLEAQVGEGLVDASVNNQAQDAMRSYKNNFLGYEAFIKELLDVYAYGLKDKSEKDVEASTDKFFSETSDFFGYVEPTVNLLLQTHEVAIVTGSSQFTAKAVAKMFGIKSYISTQFSSDNGILDGSVQAYLATRHEKKDAIEHLTNKHPHKGSFGFGDSEGDIEMLLTVENAICIAPTIGLAKIAHERGWIIINSQEELVAHRVPSVVSLVLTV